MNKIVTTLLLMFCAQFSFAQTTVTGSVYDIYLEPVSSIKITIDEVSTRTDVDGRFLLEIDKFLPVSMIVSGVGYKTQTIEVSNPNELSVVVEKQSKLQEIIVSASRIPERVLESPVTVERVGQKNIKSGTSFDFYDNLANLKDVDIHTSGFGVKSINTRAFASIDNFRFVQLVDGADTSNPSYNFSLGNSMGLNELDVASVEILPGAASALYGANAFNGILIMNSKNPFDYEGISASFKTGFTSQESTSNSPFYDTSVRVAHVFNDKFAVKVNFNHLRAQEWQANDFSNTNGLEGDLIDGDRSLPDYDGVNVYGDEFNVNFKDGLRVLEGFGFFPVGTSNGLPSFKFTRDGFNETDLTDGNVKTTTFDGSIYYRPFGNEDVEFIFNSKYGIGDNSFIKGNSRISQKGARNQQHKLDFKYKNYLTARAYYTGFNQGDNSHNLLLLGAALNTEIKDAETWFTEYVLAYTETYLTGIQNSLTTQQAEELAQSQARAFANSLNPEIGTTAFRDLLRAAKTIGVSDSGARLQNESNLYHGDLNLNLTDFIKVFGLQLGGSYRQYQLNSNGQLYTDATSPISYNEFGLYTQASVKALNERLALTSSVRYDKSQNFDGNWSPRISATYAAGENRGHNFRISYQTAFRNPTSEDQYGGGNIGSRITALGNITENYGRYVSSINPFSPGSPGEVITGGNTSVTLTGNDVINNSYTLESEQIFNEAMNIDVGNNVSLDMAYSNNIDLLERATIAALKPEKVQTFELGYRGEFDFFGSIFEADFNGYYSRFDNFITTQIVSTPFYGDVNTTADTNAAQALNSLDYSRYALRVNSSEKLDFYGAGVTLSTKIFNDFDFSTNYMFSELKNQKEIEERVKPGFNTSKHRVRLSFGKEEIFRNLGFNINARWQDNFLWQSPYLNKEIDARTVLDAQINLQVESLKSNFKLGGTNLLGKEYISAPGLGSIGSLYYINWTINVL